MFLAWSAVLGVQASGRSIYIYLSSSFLFWGLWGVPCYFLSPFPMGHWKDPQICSLIYFLTWDKITLGRVLINYLIVLGLCFPMENWELVSFSKNVHSTLGIRCFRAKHEKYPGEQIQTQSLLFHGGDLMGQRVWNR